MKALFFSLFFFIISSVSTSAQQWGLTLGSGFGTEIKTLGFQGGGFYHLREDIRIASDFTYYLTKKDNNFGLATIEDDWMELNVNGQFGYIPEDNVFLYSLAGFNLSFLESIGGQNTPSETKFGINLGGGFDFRRNMIGFYGEVKYTLFTEQISVYVGSRLFF